MSAPSLLPCVSLRSVSCLFPVCLSLCVCAGRGQFHSLTVHPEHLQLICQSNQHLRMIYNQDNEPLQYKTLVHLSRRCQIIQSLVWYRCYRQVLCDCFDSRISCSRSAVLLSACVSGSTHQLQKICHVQPCPPLQVYRFRFPSASSSAPITKKLLQKRENRSCDMDLWSNAVFFLLP